MTIDLDALETLADEASEGPWTLKTGQTTYPECDDADSWSAVLTPRGHEIVTLYERYGIKGEDRSDYDEDAAFIAAANPATVKALIAELKEAKRLMKPFATYYDINDLDERAADDTLEVPVGDLRLARAFLARNGKGEG